MAMTVSRSSVEVYRTALELLLWTEGTAGHLLSRIGKPIAILLEHRGSQRGCPLRWSTQHL